MLLLAGCGGVLDPQGPIGSAERIILLDSVAIMLVVVGPTIVVTLGFAWWFRASNAKANRRPDWAYSGQLELLVWAVPALVVMFLGGIAWIGSHALDPYAPIASKAAPIEVEVVSLDWKWLFIYPDQGVASLNELVMPTNTPVHFRLTSGTVMNSFFVPQLGSQIYTMAGMTTQLSLQADQPGVYQGLSAQFSGDGFANMRFDVKAVSGAEFAAWMTDARGSTDKLDDGAYQALLRPGVEPGVHRYGTIEPGLFEAILKQSTAAPLTKGAADAAPFSSSQ